MYTMIISISVALAVALGLGLTDTLGWGWSVTLGVLAFFASNLLLGVLIIGRKVKAGMAEVQGGIIAGQKRLQVKIASWQRRPPGSMQAAQIEIERDSAVFLREAIQRCEALLHRYERWMPMLRRSIATAELQFYWQLKDFRKVDELMPKAILNDPMLVAMRLARMQMLNKPVEEMTKVYDKAISRVRGYNKNVLLAGTWSWILVKRGEVDGAFKALNRALENSDNPVLKSNREALANNRLAHFNNSGLGDQWYSLQLEEPRMHQPRQRMQWR